MTQKANAIKLTAAQRKEKALNYRKAGMTYRQIGEQLGVTFQAAYKMVIGALEDINDRIRENAEELRSLELERLDTLFLAMYNQAIKGNQGAVDRCIRIMERRSKLLGLDAPSKASVEFSRMSNDELAEFIRQELTANGGSDSGSE
jgi:hypothetical protein